jgi:hypothetical protein
MEFFPGFLALAFCAAFAAAGLSRRTSFAARSRLDLVLSGVDAAAVLVFARALMPWSSVSPWVWMIPAAVFAVGVGACVLRWGSLPALRPGRAVWSSVTVAVASLAVAIAMVFFFYG